MIADAADGHTHVPATVRQILKDTLALREVRDAGRVAPEQLAQQVLRLTGRVDLLLAADAACCEADRKLAEHLRVERDALFTFLVVPGVQATNWRAEQGIRPIVVNRRHWGGDRTRQGADTLQVLASVLRSARQQHRDPVGILVPLLTSPVPIVAGLAVPGRGHPRPEKAGLIVPGHGDPAQPPGRLMAGSERSEPEHPQPGRYRMVVTERRDPHTATVILDADGDAFVAAIGYARNQRLTGQQGHGGTSEHVHDLAHLIADTLLH